MSKTPKPRKRKKASRSRKRGKVYTPRHASTAGKELRGPVLEVLRELLEKQRTDEVVELVSKLVSRNEELEQMLLRLHQRKNRREGAQRSARSVHRQAAQAE